MEPELPGTPFVRSLGADPTLLVVVGTVLAALGGMALIAVVVAMVRLLRRSVVAQVPILGEHAIELARPGGHAIHLEAPMLSRIPGGPIFNFFGLQFGGPRLSLRDGSTQEEVPLEAPILPAESSGFSRARRQLLKFNAPKAGRYILTCTGADPQRDWSQCEFVVTQPYSLKMLLQILLAIVGLITFMGGATLLGWWAMMRLGL